MTDPKPRTSYKVSSAFKYPSEDECLVRRLGSAVLATWTAFSPELQERIIAEAVSAWDREHGVARLSQKLETLIRRYPAGTAPMA